MNDRGTSYVAPKSDVKACIFSSEVERGLQPPRTSYFVTGSNF
jgi:hypothetical protein